MTSDTQGSISAFNPAIYLFVVFWYTKSWRLLSHVLKFWCTCVLCNLDFNHALKKYRYLYYLCSGSNWCPVKDPFSVAFQRIYSFVTTNLAVAMVSHLL